MIGDSIDDMKSGKLAGTTTILIKSNANQSIRNIQYTDYVIDKLDDLILMINQGILIK